MILKQLLQLSLAQMKPDESVVNLPNGIGVRWITHGVIEIEPATPASIALILSAGVHGNETAPAELLDRLIASIWEGDVIPRCRVLAVFGNPPAMAEGVRYLQTDMNRLFNGKHMGIEQPEADRANELERISEAFFDGAEYKLHYDMHTAIRESRIEKFALYPWMPGRKLPLLEAKRLGAAGIEAIVLHNQKGGTFSAFTYEKLGAESFTLELGKARPFGENLELDVSLLEKMLRDLIAGDGNVDSKSIPVEFEVTRSIIRTSESFELYVDGHCPNFQTMALGSLVARDQGHSLTIDEPDARVLFPNPKVAVGSRAALIISPRPIRFLVP